MANETPVLLLGYNRPYQMRGLIQSLAPLKPKLILFSVDGPKTNRPRDAELVRQTQELINEITWDAEIHTRFRDCNLGLRRAVVDAITWASSDFGKVIVLEDDVRAGPQLLDFLNYNLEKYENQREIAHINGYNLVPANHITKPQVGSRLSIYIESYAWATWERAWQNYDDDLVWAKNASINELKSICGTRFGALKWKQNFSNAAASRIDTWAYRWLATIWANRFKIVSPNLNISSYHGRTDGTHTFFKVRYHEQDVNHLEIKQDGEVITVDKLADSWLKRNIFKETVMGVANGVAISELLKVKKALNY